MSESAQYARRILACISMLCVVSLPLLLISNLPTVLVAPWYWLFLIANNADPVGRWGLNKFPFAFACLTLILISAACVRKGSAIGVTVWFMLNIIGGSVAFFLFRFVSDGHS
jgi:hypothetical protein